jgi:hypothetical protein
MYVFFAMAAIKRFVFPVSSRWTRKRPSCGVRMAILASLSALDEEFPDTDRDLLPLDDIEL